MVEQPQRVFLEQPHVQVVVDQLLWQQGFVALHGTLEWLPEDLGAAFHTRGYGNEPLDTRQAERIADRFVHQDLWIHRVRNGSDQGRVEEMHAHTTVRILDTPYRRKITVPHGRVWIFVLLHLGL